MKIASPSRVAQFALESQVVLLLAVLVAVLMVVVVAMLLSGLYLFASP